MKTILFSFEVHACCIFSPFNMLQCCLPIHTERGINRGPCMNKLVTTFPFSLKRDYFLYPQHVYELLFIVHLFVWSDAIVHYKSLHSIVIIIIITIMLTHIQQVYM